MDSVVCYERKCSEAPIKTISTIDLKSLMRTVYAFNDLKFKKQERPTIFKLNVAVTNNIILFLHYQAFFQGPVDQRLIAVFIMNLIQCSCFAI